MEPNFLPLLAAVAHDTDADYADRLGRLKDALAAVYAKAACGTVWDVGQYLRFELLVRKVVSARVPANWSRRGSTCHIETGLFRAGVTLDVPADFAPMVAAPWLVYAAWCEKDVNRGGGT